MRRLVDSFRKPITALCVLLVLLFSVPAAGLAASTQPNAHRTATGKSVVFAFGRTGGNIIPVRVTIISDGSVAVHGPVHSSSPPGRLSSDALKGLLKLANAEKFFSLPPHMSGGLYPDSASLFITVATQTKKRTVFLHATHNARFDELLALLMQVTHVSF